MGDAAAEEEEVAGQVSLKPFNGQNQEVYRQEKAYAFKNSDLKHVLI
jgi:hypothetical protein